MLGHAQPKDIAVDRAEWQAQVLGQPDQPSRPEPVGDHHFGGSDR